jgi:hypothetical protein
VRLSWKLQQQLMEKSSICNYPGHKKIAPHNGEAIFFQLS